MDERDLSRLLSDAAASPASELDQAAIDRGVARRRRRRHTLVGGAAAAALVLVATTLGVVLLGDDDSADLQFVDTPATSTTTAPGGDHDAMRRQDEHLHDLPQRGVAIKTDGGLLVVGLDGSEHLVSHLGLGDPALIEGLASPVVSRLPVVERDELYWWEPGWDHGLSHSTHGFRLAYSGWVGGGVPFMRGGPFQIDTAARWWVSHDLRALTWTECEEGCEHHGYDSLTQQEFEVPYGCWVATLSATGSTLICEDGQVVVPSDGGEVRTSPRPGTQPVRAIAAWPNGVVWLDHGTCFSHEAVMLQDGELRSIVADSRAAAPSAIPLDIAPDGRMIVHLNAAACDAADADMGVYLVDLQTQARELIWAGPALPGEVRAWSPAESRLAALASEGTVVPLGSLGDEFVHFGQQGVGRVVGGAIEWWWTDGAVTRAYPDGDDGIVFQAPGAHPLEGMGAAGHTGAILHMSQIGDPPNVLVPEGDGATLLYVSVYEGQPTVFFTRHEFPPDPVDHLDASQVLYALGLDSGVETSLGEIGHGASQVSEMVIESGEVLLRRCSETCTVERGSGASAVEAAVPTYHSGLAAIDGALATVELEWSLTQGYQRGTLVVFEADGTERYRVPLPADPHGSPWAWVDLSTDGRSALVVWPYTIVHEPVTFDVVLVTGLDTSEPRVQIVRTDQALRFG